MALPNDVLCANVFKYPWGAIEKMTFLTGNPPKRFLISNIDNLITYQGKMEEEAVNELYMELDKCRI